MISNDNYVGVYIEGRFFQSSDDVSFWSYIIQNLFYMELLFFEYPIAGKADEVKGLVLPALIGIWQGVHEVMNMKTIGFIRRMFKWKNKSLFK